MSAWPRLSEFLSAHRHAPTLSVYLEAAPADPAEARAVTLRLRAGIERLRDAAASASQQERDALEACLNALIEAIPNAELRSRRQGWAYFRTADGAALAIDTPAGVETSAAWGIGPRVVPFLRAAAPESALLVQVDRVHARIGLLHDGVVDTIVELEADRVEEPNAHLSAGPTRGTRGHTAADETQRLRKEASDRLLATALRRAVTLAEDTLPIVVGGATETVKHFLAGLPRPLAERSVAVPALKMGATEPAMPDILTALREMHRKELANHIEELRGAAAAHGRATFGIDDTQKAAELGAIAELIFSDSAWRARPEEVEALVHRALTSGATVEWAPLSEADVAQADGIVAGLRFAL